MSEWNRRNHTIEFSVEEDGLEIQIKTPPGISSLEAIQAKAKLVSDITEAAIKLHEARAQYGSFVQIPFERVVKSIWDKLESEFTAYEEVMRKIGLTDLFLHHGDNRGFVRNWKFGERNEETGEFVLKFCILGGKCWFGIPDQE